MELTFFVSFRAGVRKPRVYPGVSVIFRKSYALVSWKDVSTTYKHTRKEATRRSAEEVHGWRHFVLNAWLSVFRSLEIAALTLRTTEVSLFFLTLVDRVRQHLA